MDVSRAQQILHADDRIGVQLNGVSVWIDSVDTAKEMAKVHPENNPQDIKEVPINQLQEVQ